MKIKNWSLVLTLIFGSLQVLAIDEFTRKTIEGQGRLVTVRFVFGDKNAKLYLVGKEAAKLDLNKDAKLLTLTAFTTDGKKEELHYTEEQGFYTIQKLPNMKAPYTLSVSAKVKDVEETIKVQYKP